MIPSSPGVAEPVLQSGRIARLADIVGKAADAARPSGDLPIVSRSAYPWDHYLAEPKGE